MYADGSEARGALSAEVSVRYGSLEGVAAVTVWYPRLPLEVRLVDRRLSQIRGWQTELAAANRVRREVVGSSAKQEEEEEEEEDDSKAEAEGSRCRRNRYQQTSVSVYGSFSAEDPDSGRRDFFPSRSAELDLTDLLLRAGRPGALRVEESAVATLRGSTVEGRRPGRTEIQVRRLSCQYESVPSLSPLVIGETL